MKTIEKYLKWVMKRQGKHVIYRGLADQSWKATSSLERKLGEGVDFATMLKYTEEDLLKEREKKSHVIERDKTLSDLEMLVFLQHHHIETILIDFTSSPLVALWFACKDESVDGKIISVDASDREKFTEISGENAEKTISYFSREDKLYKLMPSVDLTERIATQNSVFIFGAKGVTNSICEKFIINKEKKGELLAALREKFGTHKKTVFPEKPSGFKFRVNLHNSVEERHHKLGQQASQQGEPDKAINKFTDVIELNKDSYVAYNDRGIAYAQQGEYRKAIDDLTKSIEVNPNEARLYNNRGLVYNENGEDDNALIDLDIAIKLDPNYADAYSNRGTVYGGQQKYGRAIQDFNKAIILNPKHVAAYSNRGVAYANQGEYNKAIYDFSKVIEIDPNYKNAYADRGQAYLAKQEYDKAINDFDIALKLNPNDVITYNNRGTAYGNQGNHSKAMDNFSQAVKLDSSYADAHNNLGLAKQMLGDEKGAQEAFARARELAGSPPVQG